VVDDSALVRKLLGQVFAGEPDFEVAFARDGQEGLEVMAAFQPDVITLDVQMPRLDGLATLDRIMIERPCPVVMISSLTTDGAEATLEALRLGAVDFVPKPSGAVSMRMDTFAPQVVATVRTAAGARLRLAHRLKDRVRHRIGSAADRGPARRDEGMGAPAAARATGQGLVLVGTSTGGPPALEALLVPLPGNFPWPILVAQHMPASFTGALARRLNGLCALEVVECADAVQVQPGTVYIGRGDADLVVSRRGDVIMARPAPSIPGYPWRPSADRLVRTAMEHVAARQLLGVLMTGMGDDGAQAMAQLHAQGGRTIAEAQETAVVWGMPGELVKAGGADFVVPVDGIAARLWELMP
jgi:two-component system chemotaxis response regulator CheB